MNPQRNWLPKGWYNWNSLEENFGTIKQLDEEILDLVDDESVTDEIEQADNFGAQVYTATVEVLCTWLEEKFPEGGRR